jgi:hypothetical protein
MSLRPIQAAALQAIHDFGGLVAPIPVGGGKTLVSVLAGPVSGTERVLLLLPAKLVRKTQREFARLARHWRKPKRLHTISYELLARDRGEKELAEFMPTMIIADEAHKLKSPRATCTKRVLRYLKEHTECRYVDMSGTTFGRSLMELWHRQKHALPKGMQCLPDRYSEMRDWADALDETPGMIGRLMPGAMFQFYDDSELTKAAAAPHDKALQVHIARGAFKRRLCSVPAIVSADGMWEGAPSLSITEVAWPMSADVRSAFHRLREDWSLPDGHPIDEPAQLWFAARCLVQGFYYKWDPPPPPEWLYARKEWGRTLRDILSRYKDLDSNVRAVQAIEQGRIPEAEAVLAQWRAIKDTFAPKTKAYWIDDQAARFCAAWAKKNKGIVWVNEVALGERLQAEYGIPYYGAQGMCGDKMIEDETSSCVASVAANKEGRNLQFHFATNLVTAPPPTGGAWEQMLGRTHREGQSAEEVTVEVGLGCYENWKVLQQARFEADFAERTGGQAQKLLFADWDIPGADIVRKREGWEWSKENADYFADKKGWNETEIQAASMSVDDRAQMRKQALTIYDKRD